MSATFTPTEYESAVAYLEARLWTEGWVIREEQLDALAGVLPIGEGMPHASVVTDTHAAFVLGGTLMVASWDDDRRLTTELLPLADTPLTIVWNADWLSDYAAQDSDEVPDERPMTVTLRTPSGETHVLPFDAAWHNVVGCVNFASTLIEKAHGFRPAVGTPHQAATPKTWKR